MRFNPRPTRGATSANNARAYTNVFQSTPPREGRHKAFEAYTKFIKFQSTPPHEGRLDAIIGALIQTEFQSTPPHEGRPCLSLPILRLSCFNPRPHTRGDGPCRLSYTHVFEFQSTPPRGRRQLVVGHGCSLSVVSIHALARGATAFRSSCRQSYWSFNPRPRAGGDCIFRK